MQAFDFYSPTHIVFGPGTEAQAGSLAAAEGAPSVSWWFTAGKAASSSE